MIVYTLGHSTLALDAFLHLLDVHGIRGIADVRRFPGSRRHPHFAGAALASGLEPVGVGYDWLPELGGRRTVRRDSPHRSWRVAAFRGYADHMESAEFAAGFERLLELARTRTTAVMCAEAVPWRCHRQLVADLMTTRGIEVRHVLSPTSVGTHRLTDFARIDGDRLVYDLEPRGRLSGL